MDIEIISCRRPSGNDWQSKHSMDITALIINYRTPDLTRRCLESLLNFYPDVRALLVDNGSDDDSRKYIAGVSASHANISCILNQTNRYHGPALDQGVRRCSTGLVLTLDSDCQILRAGFLEQMCNSFEQESDLYAIGKIVQMDPFGYETANGGRFHFSYIRPSCMLLSRNIYLKLHPFIHHGSPGIRNMRDALKHGYRLQDFSIDSYILHIGRGTCSRYGYGLGMRHKIENVLHRVFARFW